MSKLNVDKMIASARACLGWPYVSPGTNNANGIDCSGLFVKIFKDQGATIYHGSNTIYRKYLTKEKGPLTNVKQLEPGMAVFKHKDKDTAKYPDGLGDFCHIGIVAAVNPLQIIHASSAAGCVTTDEKLGKWTYYGKLKDVIYPDGTTIYDPKEVEKDEEPVEIPVEDDTPVGDNGVPKEQLNIPATVVAENGKPVKLRMRPNTSCALYDSVPVGSVVNLVEYGEDWCKVDSDKRRGWYMMTKFLDTGAVG